MDRILIRICLKAVSYTHLLSSPLPIPEWGSMMNEGRSMLQFAPWVTISPGMAILITVVLFNLLGDIVTEILGTKQRRRS